VRICAHARRRRDIHRVDIAVRARLSGPLAQFSRAGIVEDVARRLIRTFAENLEHRLSGRAIARDPRAGSAALNIGSLLFLAWRARVRGRIARLLGRTKA
jgi:aerobic carbon-monoxide dehydrogenase small subunit